MPPAEEREALTLFEGLLRAHYQAGFRLARAMLRGRDEAEDVLQVAAFRAWRALRRGQRVDAERSWFLAIVANECRSAVRRRWWSVVHLANLRLSEATSSMDDSLDLRRAIARLPHGQRLVIVLHFYLDLPYAEIGAITGISEEAARARTHRALHTLEHRLARDLQEGAS